jgi:hypothetical protein
MRTLVLYLFFLLGVTSLLLGTYMLWLAVRGERNKAERSDRRLLAIGVLAFPAFFIAVGILGLLVFAVPPARLWATYAIALLFLSREVAFRVAAGIQNRRERV